MTNPSTIQPEVLQDNKPSINTFLKDSYSQAKKQLQGGMELISESVTFLKDEFSFMYDKTSSCLHRMALPVNNFLKDISQIDADFQQELVKESGQYMCL